MNSSVVVNPTTSIRQSLSSDDRRAEWPLASRGPSLHIHIALASRCQRQGVFQLYSASRNNAARREQDLE